MKRNERFCPYALLLRSPLFLFLTFVRCHAGILQCHHTFSTAAFASGFLLLEASEKLMYQIVIA